MSTRTDIEEIFDSYYDWRDDDPPPEWDGHEPEPSPEPRALSAEQELEIAEQEFRRHAAINRGQVSHQRVDELRALRERVAAR